MEKIKLEELLVKVAGEALKDAIKTAKPKYKEKTDVELAEIFGLSEFQFTHLTEKALGRAVSERLEEEMETTFVAGNSVEVPHQFMVFVHESKARKTKSGVPVRKLSIRTRKALKHKINN